jgi:hypothetical protein
MACQKTHAIQRPTVLPPSLRTDSVYSEMLPLISKTGGHNGTAGEACHLVGATAQQWAIQIEHVCNLVGAQACPWFDFCLLGKKLNTANAVHQPRPINLGVLTTVVSMNLVWRRGREPFAIWATGTEQPAGLVQPMLSHAYHLFSYALTSLLSSKFHCYDPQKLNCLN